MCLHLDLSVTKLNDFNNSLPIIITDVPPPLPQHALLSSCFVAGRQTPKRSLRRWKSSTRHWTRSEAGDVLTPSSWNISRLFFIFVFFINKQKCPHNKFTEYLQDSSACRKGKKFSSSSHYCDDLGWQNCTTPPVWMEFGRRTKKFGSIQTNPITVWIDSN